MLKYFEVVMRRFNRYTEIDISLCDIDLINDIMIIDYSYKGSLLMCV